LNSQKNLKRVVSEKKKSGVRNEEADGFSASTAVGAGKVEGSRWAVKKMRSSSILSWVKRGGIWNRDRSVAEVRTELDSCST